MVIPEAVCVCPHCGEKNFERGKDPDTGAIPPMIDCEHCGKDLSPPKRPEREKMILPCRISNECGIEGSLGKYIVFIKCDALDAESSGYSDESYEEAEEMALHNLRSLVEYREERGWERPVYKNIKI